MLEEKNDNLLNADGSENVELIHSNKLESQEASKNETVEDSTLDLIPDTEVEAQLIPESEQEKILEVEDLVGELIEEPTTESTTKMTKNNESIDESNIVELTPVPLANYVLEKDHKTNDILNSIANVNAEESEDETVRQEIPLQNYESLSMEALVAELDILVTNDKVMSVKDHVEEVKKEFLAKYHHFVDEKKDEFHAENPDTTEDFHYHFPLKIKFDQLYTQYRERKNIHFKSLQTNLKTNLENRLAIVEELKGLINPQENIKDTLKHFNDLRDRWKNGGPIPKDKYNHVWNNYHFHVENFYDYLHLDREARDLDFKHNLDQKLKIIARVEELVNEADINKAFRELQDLHKIWKEDIGPVSRENREVVWNKFSELTKQMHDKRELLFEKLRGTEVENLATKNEIITKIEVLSEEKVGSHSAWLAQVEKVEALRTDFFAAGKVPSDVNEETWARFKNAVRNFNVLKNSFYKDIKKDQNDNLTRKQALVAKANELKESPDFDTTTPIMKKIQEEWKEIGHVPRKYSDKLWTEFRGACNSYFEKLKEQKSEENAEEIEAFESKKNYLETLKTFEMTGDHKTDLDAIKLHIETWKGFGKVPFPRRHIEGKFNKILDTLFEKLSLSKKDTDMMRFANRIDQLTENNETRKIENEKIFIIRKIEEIQNEILQLENNIQFFTNTRNAKKENSIVLEVRKNIAEHKESLDVWKEKLKQLRSLK